METTMPTEAKCMRCNERPAMLPEYTKMGWCRECEEWRRLQVLKHTFKVGQWRQSWFDTGAGRTGGMRQMYWKVIRVNRSTVTVQSEYGERKPVRVPLDKLGEINELVPEKTVRALGLEEKLARRKAGDFSYHRAPGDE